MHPTLNAMVAAEREVHIARAAERRSNLETTSSGYFRRTAPLLHLAWSIGHMHALVAVKSAFAQQLSRPMASRRGGAADPEVCCA